MANLIANRFNSSKHPLVSHPPRNNSPPYNQENPPPPSPSFPPNGIPANIYLYKVNNRNSRKRCETCSTLAIKTLERRQRTLPIVDFEQVNVS